MFKRVSDRFSDPFSRFSNRFSYRFKSFSGAISFCTRAALTSFLKPLLHAPLLANADPPPEEAKKVTTRGRKSQMAQTNEHGAKRFLRNLSVVCLAARSGIFPIIFMCKISQEDVNGEKLTVKKWWDFWCRSFHGLRRVFHGLRRAFHGLRRNKNGEKNKNDLFHG